MNTTYLLVTIWIISHIICAYILKQRGIKVGLGFEMLGIFLGPFAIPLALTVSGKKALDNRSQN